MLTNDKNKFLYAICMQFFELIIKNNNILMIKNEKCLEVKMNKSTGIKGKM